MDLGVVGTGGIDCMGRAAGPGLLMILAAIRTARRVYARQEVLAQFTVHPGSISAMMRATLLAHYARMGQSLVAAAIRAFARFFWLGPCRCVFDPQGPIPADP